MPASTPIATCKTAALARVLDSVPKGYTRWTSGTVNSEKVVALAAKFHRIYGIGLSPGKRLTRRHHGQANCLLVIYWPENSLTAHWLLLATPGEGLESERWVGVADKPRLVWLGYELVRYASRGKTIWTWRRTKTEMAEHYALLNDHFRRHQLTAVEALLQRLARQPGFHGVREQSWTLFQYALSRGYVGELPHLYFLQKVSHGERLVLSNGRGKPTAECGSA